MMTGSDWIHSILTGLTLLSVIVCAILTHSAFGEMESKIESMQSDIVELKVSVGILNDRSDQRSATASNDPLPSRRPR